MKVRALAGVVAAAAAALGSTGCHNEQYRKPTSVQAPPVIGLERTASPADPAAESESVLDRAGRTANQKVDQLADRTAAGTRDYYDRAEAGVGRIAEGAADHYQRTVDRVGRGIQGTTDAVGDAYRDKADRVADATEDAAEETSEAVGAILEPPALPETDEPALP